VTWTGCGDAFEWWPFGPFDWRRLRADASSPWPIFCDDDFWWYRYPWSGEEVWVSVPEQEARPPEYAKRRGAAGPGPAPSPRPRRQPLPRELRPMAEQLDRLAARLGSEAPEPVRTAIRREVPRPDGAPRERVAPSTDPAEAGDHAAPETLAAVAPTPALPRPTPVEARFRDWNPDVRAARAAGVGIRYDSALNQVVCLGCRAWRGSGAQPGASGGLSASRASEGGGASGGGASGSAPAGPAGGAAGAGAGGARSGPIDR
jgi:hypothetical protein